MSRKYLPGNYERATNPRTLASDYFDTLEGRVWYGTPTIPGAPAGAPTTGTWALNEYYWDGDGVKWRCTVAGTPGTWVQDGGGGSWPGLAADYPWTGQHTWSDGLMIGVGTRSWWGGPSNFSSEGFALIVTQDVGSGDADNASALLTTFNGSDSATLILAASMSGLNGLSLQNSISGDSIAIAFKSVPVGVGSTIGAAQIEASQTGHPGGYVKVTTKGDVLLAGAGTDAAADTGFVFFPSCPTTPTGVPELTAFTYGIPTLFCSTDDKFYANFGAGWKCVNFYTDPSTADYQWHGIHNFGATVRAVEVYSRRGYNSNPTVIDPQDSGAIVSNGSLSADVDFFLPHWAQGLFFTFDVEVAHNLKVKAQSGETIRIGPSVTSAGGSIDSSTVGTVVTVAATESGKWVATSVIGTWNFL